MVGVKGEFNKQKRACSEKKGDLMVRAVHGRGILERKRVDERLVNFNSVQDRKT